MKITKHINLLSILFGALCLLLTPNFVFAGGEKAYEVTVTNITKGVIFTPILVATHRAGVKLFELGAPASEELERLAEGGDVVPLTDELLADSRVGDVVNSGGVLPPGESVTILATAPQGNRFLSLAAMLVPTNDGFVAVNSIALPLGYFEKTTFALGYDAGTEINDESCLNIPAAGGCAGIGYSPDGGEGFVHIHSGIHGIEDLEAADYDWGNPIAHITIKRVKNLDD